MRERGEDSRRQRHGEMGKEKANQNLKRERERFEKQRMQEGNMKIRERTQEKKCPA